MLKNDKEMARCAEKLIDEISGMKFSFKKIVKIIELDAVISYFNK